LAGCDTGGPAAPAGEELLALGAPFTARAPRQLVASVTAIPDAQTAHLMTAFHQAVAAGVPAATALADTQHRLAAEDLATMVTAAAFICIGGEYTRARA